jgi:hypothetical protein
MASVLTCEIQIQQPFRALIYQMTALCHCCSCYVENLPEHLRRCIEVPPDHAGLGSMGELSNELQASVEKYMAFLQTIPITTEDNRRPLQQHQLG